MTILDLNRSDRFPVSPQMHSTVQVGYGVHVLAAGAASMHRRAMKQSFEVKPKIASLASPFSIHFEARLKPLGWSSPIDLCGILCAAGGKNPGFGLLVAIYASKNQVSLPQPAGFPLAVLRLESPADQR
jgi:hypothetical protein